MKGIYLETVFEVHVSILDPSGLFFWTEKKQRKWFPTGLQSWPISQSFLDYQLTSQRPHSKGLDSLKRMYIPLLQHVICESAYNTSQWRCEITSWQLLFLYFRAARTRPRSKRFHFQSMPRMKSNLGWWDLDGIGSIPVLPWPPKKKCKYNI